MEAALEERNEAREEELTREEVERRLKEVLRSDSVVAHSGDSAVNWKADDEAAAEKAAEDRAEAGCIALEENYLAGQSFDALSSAVSPSQWEHSVAGARQTPAGMLQRESQVGAMMG